jgi:hypothetical protein
MNRREWIYAAKVLRSAPDATPKIKEQLELGAAGVCAQRLDQAAVGRFVASESLLAVMDKVTGLFAELKA